jgi:hypothetical protein
MLIDSVWAGPLLWMAVYTSDYYLTIACARLYRGQSTIVFEGSYEITPMFQADVNALRKVSPRFLLLLVLSTLYLLLVWTLTRILNGFFALYELALGIMLLSEATVHVRHFRNLFQFSRIAALEGRVTYPRGIVLRGSAVELLLFAGLYACLFGVTRSIFVLGGVVGCGALSFNHYQLARRHDAAVSNTA